jgi:hypothetical protein
MGESMNTITKRVYSYENDFKDFVRDSAERKPLLIDSDMMYYWLEVLPPVYMNKVQTVKIDGVTFNKQCSFGFAEGTEYITDFWPAGGGNYWALLSDRVNR